MAAVLGVAVGVGLGGAEASGKDAALAYYRVWRMMEQGMALGLLSDDDEFRLSVDGTKRLLKAQDLVEGLIEASAIGNTDWDIAYEEGPLALLPHLGLMRTSARVLGADVLRCEASGDHAQAVERIAALYRMGNDVSHDRNVIGSLVGLAIWNEANKLANHVLDAGSIDSDGATVMLTAIRELKSTNRFGMRDAIVGEWRMIAEFLVSRAPEDGAGKWLVETMQMEDNDELTKKIAAMDKAALMRDLGGWSAFYSDILGAWDAADRARMDAVVERLKDCEYGTLAIAVSPSLTRAFDANQRTKEDLQALTKRLEGIGD